MISLGLTEKGGYLVWSNLDGHHIEQCIRTGGCLQKEQLEKKMRICFCEVIIFIWAISIHTIYINFMLLHQMPQPRQALGGIDRHIDVTKRETGRERSGSGSC